MGSRFQGLEVSQVALYGCRALAFLGLGFRSVSVANKDFMETFESFSLHFARKRGILKRGLYRLQSFEKGPTYSNPFSLIPMYTSVTLITSIHSHTPPFHPRPRCPIRCPQTES